jgi:hypothetical protein
MPRAITDDKKPVSSPQLSRSLIAFAAVPTVIYFIISAMLTYDPTHDFGVRLLKENGPVELASFACMTSAGVLGLILAYRVRSRVTKPVLVGLTLCGLGFFVIGMEEISWGQQFFEWQTPEVIAKTNAQNETTFHNHQLFQEYLEIFAILFALAGLIGVALNRSGVLKDLMPRPIFFWWFVPLLVVASLDLMHEFWIPSYRFDMLINHLDEVNEMICAMIALTFVLFKTRELCGTVKASGTAR